VLALGWIKRCVPVSMVRTRALMGDPLTLTLLTFLLTVSTFSIWKSWQLAFGNLGCSKDGDYLGPLTRNPEVDPKNWTTS